MNKAELIAGIAENANLTKAQAALALDGFVSVVTNTPSNNEKMTSLGFGTFNTGVREARLGRNPLSGAEIKIPRKTIAKFKPGKDLAGSVNN